MTSASFTSNSYTTTRGTKTHYLQSGDSEGTLVICLHGLGRSTDTFKLLTKFFPASYNIALVDFQGFGRTPLTSKTEPLSISNHVSDVHDLVLFLQEVTRQRPKMIIFIGHSPGTIIAIHYAAQYASNVAGLALLGVGRSAAHIPVQRQRMLDVASNTRKHGIDFTADRSVAHSFPSPEERIVPPENLEEVRKAVAAADPEGYARTCEMIVDPSHVDPDYAKIRCPAVFVAGDLNSISPPQRFKDVSGLLGGPSWIKIVRSGHQPLMDDTEANASAVLKLLEMV